MVFKLKHAVDGKVEYFKARLVAKGDAQKYGIMMKYFRLKFVSLQSAFW